MSSRRIAVALVVLILGVLSIANAFALTKGDYQYKVLKDGTVEITKYVGKNPPSHLKIPGTIAGKKVTSIGAEAFRNLGFSTKKVTIPDGVKSIGKAAFYWNMGLNYVVIPNSVRSIGVYAFAGCQLNSIDIPSGVTSIGCQAFDSCFSLKKATIPETVKEITGNPFTCCYDLVVYVSPDSKYFAMVDGVLYEKATKRLVCYPFTLNNSKYDIPEGTKSIADYAFFCVYGLKKVVIPDTVTTIGECALDQCTDLVDLTVPASVSSIGKLAFYGCSPKLVVTVPRGSYAAGYCKDNKLNYTYPDNNNDWLNKP